MQTTRRMRSAAVSLGLVGTLALSLTGCGIGQSAQRRCVDASSFTVVDDQNCLAATPAPGATGSTYHSYRYYYGGRISGGRVTGGSFTAPSTSHSSTSSKTSSTRSDSGSSSKGGVRTGGFGHSASGKSGSS